MVVLRLAWVLEVSVAWQLFVCTGSYDVDNVYE